MRLLCWLGWHRWNSTTAWSWQQWCTRCGTRNTKRNADER